MGTRSFVRPSISAVTMLAVGLLAGTGLRLQAGTPRPGGDEATDTCEVLEAHRAAAAWKRSPEGRRWMAEHLQAGGAVAGFPASGVNLLSHIPRTMFGSSVGDANDCWGYVSPSGREYGILGLESGTGFVEITDPTDPQVIANVPDNTSIWSDMQTYQHYCYNVNESGGGMQIIDLSRIDEYLISLVGSAAGGMQTAHDLAINQDSGFVYPCGTDIARGFLAFSLSDPRNPQFVGSWNETYVHDLQVVSYDECPYSGRSGPCEIAYAFAGRSGFKTIDVTDKSAMTTLATRTYPNLGYCHQGWLSPNRKYTFIDDEFDEGDFGITTTTYVFNVQDVGNPQYLTSFTNGLRAIDHNLMVRGEYVFEANYASGLRIYHYDPTNLTPVQSVGYFDTSALSDNLTGYFGAWGPYTMLPSGVVLVADIEEGLFVLDVSPATGCQADSHCNDQNECTADACVAGACTHSPLPIGTACDDSNHCTIGGQCDAAGVCVSTDVNTIPCTDDTPCAPGICDTGSGLCVCLPCVRAAAPAAETVVTPKNRALSFRPGNTGERTALRVVFTSLPSAYQSLRGTVMWAGEPETVCELSGFGPGDGCPPGAPTFTLSRLSCTPAFADWGSLGTVHIVDRLIVPGATYGVQSTSEACYGSGNSKYSTPIAVATSRWGDVVSNCTTTPCGPPDGTVNVVNDVLAVLDKFGNRSGAPIKARADLDPWTPDLRINITDVTRCVDAFRALPFPYPPPAGPPCP